MALLSIGREDILSNCLHKQTDVFSANKYRIALHVNRGGTSVDTLDAPRVRQFFNVVSSSSASSKTERPAVLVVTHLLADRPYFLEAISKVSNIKAIFPKPKTIDPTVRSLISRTYPIEVVSRDQMNKPDACLLLLNKYGKGVPLVLIDIGGYFAKSLNALISGYSGKILGVVEDTENGHQKYAAVKPECPVISVARSPLKNPEDFLVGQSIVFSTEALLRERGDILHGRTACIIGYGKIGRSIAGLLHARHVRTVVCDTDPVKCVDAMSHGFSVAHSVEHAIKDAGLVFCATGNRALEKDHFRMLNSGSYIVTVTSSEDELELDQVRKAYRVKHVSDFVARYADAKHHFYVLNRGQAVNFIHGAAVGPFIYLVHGEIVASISRVVSNALPNGVQENPANLRQEIAKHWLSVFAPLSYRETAHA